MNRQLELLIYYQPLYIQQFLYKLWKVKVIDMKRIELLSEELVLNKADLNSHLAVPVSDDQIELLKSLGCRSENDNWSLLNFTPESDLSLVQNCCFRGENHIHLPEGSLSNSTFENCQVEGPVTVESSLMIKAVTQWVIGS